MDLCLLGPLLYEFLLNILVEELTADMVVIVSFPVTLGSLCTLDLVVSFDFLIMVLEVTVTHDVVVSDAESLDVLSALSLNDDEVSICLFKFDRYLPQEGLRQASCREPRNDGLS